MNEVEKKAVDMNEVVWYAIQTKARQEVTAERHLANQNYTTFLPRLRVDRQRAGRWQAITEPLFPGYLFIELNLDQQNIVPSRSTRGVVRFVQLGFEITKVSNHLIESLMSVQSTIGDVVEPRELLEPGETVSLVSGPMVGLSAIFKAQNSKDRVIVLLNILGNETLVNVSPEQITKAR